MYEICPHCRLAHGEASCPQCNGEGKLFLHGLERECPFCEGEGVWACCSVSNAAETAKGYNAKLKRR